MKHKFFMAMFLSVSFGALAGPGLRMFVDGGGYTSLVVVIFTTFAAGYFNWDLYQEIKKIEVRDEGQF